MFTQGDKGHSHYDSNVIFYKYFSDLASAMWTYSPVTMIPIFSAAFIFDVTIGRRQWNNENYAAAVTHFTEWSAVTINLQWYESSLPAKFTIEFFTVYTKLAEMALLASKDLTTAKNVSSSGARPDARDYYWFRSPVPNQMSQTGICL